MRRTLVVIGIGFLSAGCYGYGHARYGYGYGGRYSYQPQPQAQVYAQPQPALGQVGVQAQPQQPQVAVGEGIAGSDGTQGWRVTSQAPTNDFQRFIQLAGRASCQAEGMTAAEFRASCTGNIHVILRIDQQNVYKLCAPNTDQAACAQIWSMIGN